MKREIERERCVCVERGRGKGGMALWFRQPSEFTSSYSFNIMNCEVCLTIKSIKGENCVN